MQYTEHLALRKPEPSDYVNINDLNDNADRIDQELHGKADRQLSNLDTPQTALYHLGAGVRPNLLDNPYFVGGGSQQGGGQLPINQRGLTNYSSAASIIDRWLFVGDEISAALESDGLLLTWSGAGMIRQKIEHPAGFSGKTVTISAFINEVNTGATNNITLRCRVNGSYAGTAIIITQSTLTALTPRP